MFGRNFGNGHNDAPRLAANTIEEAMSQLQAANEEAIASMKDTSLERVERSCALGQAEALHDMLTDLGALLINYSEYDDFDLAVTVGRVIFGWGCMVDRHLHAHKHPEGGGENLDTLISSIMEVFGGGEKTCMPMHRAQAATYRSWSFRILNFFADSLTTKAA